MAAGELLNLLKVSAVVAAAMSFAHLASATISPGRRRLLALLPIITLLLFLPLSFTTIHLRGISAFFLAWLATFKLLLLSFDLGPLSASLPLTTFISIASLPLNLRPPTANPPPRLRRLPSATKALILAAIIPLYRYNIPHYLLLSLYSIHLYLALELVLAATAFAAAALLGLELDPQFDEPYRASSLSDFWGRRWNLMVTGILRPAVYLPVRKQWGTAAGVVATFVVSGLVHELMFYYLTLAAPTGEVTTFFVVHGLCVAAEGWARRRGWRPVASVLAVPLTLGFVAVTGFWLFLPPVIRSGADRWVLEESAAALGFIVGGGQAAVGWLGWLSDRIWTVVR